MILAKLKLFRLVFIVVVAHFLIAQLNSQRIELWKSEPRNGVFLSRSADLTFTQSSSGGNFYNINVNDGPKYQQMDGFGGSLTDAATWCFFYRLTPAKRAEVLGNLFGPNGLYRIIYNSFISIN
jgi:O-glycosyl hydrolase